MDTAIHQVQKMIERIISDPIEGNGMLTNPTENKIDILKLRNYCKERKIPYEKLTEAEIDKFRVIPTKKEFIKVNALT